MQNMIKLPSNFADYLKIDNAELRFEEATDVANKIIDAGIQIYPNMDHAAIFCDPPHLVADGLKQLGYVNGWDARCYPSPVDGCDYINVSAKLPIRRVARIFVRLTYFPHRGQVLLPL